MIRYHHPLDIITIAPSSSALSCWNQWFFFFYCFLPMHAVSFLHSFFAVGVVGYSDVVTVLMRFSLGELHVFITEIISSNDITPFSSYHSLHSSAVVTLFIIQFIICRSSSLSPVIAMYFISNAFSFSSQPQLNLNSTQKLGVTWKWL